MNPPTTPTHVRAATPSSDRRNRPGIESLAHDLSVTTDSLQGLGVCRNGVAWLIPERDATGQVIGQARRFDDGGKGFVAGGKRGLTYAHPLHNYAGSSPVDPVFVVEGMSDAAAGLSMGLDIVGRPSATGGAVHLAELLKDRHVCIISENDEAGQTGAQKIAEHIAGAVNTLRIVSPPEAYKDLRTWYADGGIDMAGLLEIVDSTPAYLPAEPTSSGAGERPAVSNVRVEPVVDAEGKPALDKNDDQEQQAQALTPGEIRDLILATAGDVYTLGVDGPLFVPSTTDESAIRLLKDPPELFAWIKSKSRVYWRGKADVGGEVVSKAEITATLRAEPAASFDQVATLPHHPAMPRTYYAHPHLPKPTGERLAEFVGRLNPATDIDRDLLKAFILTPAWGGPCGGRPLFVLTSEHGRGAGKTATASAIGQIYQGVLSVSMETRDGIERLRQRILSPANAALRCVVLDNVKSAASSGEIESLITSDVIDGHRLHHGDARRPNSLTWAMTANGVGLSRDLADRSVLIRLGEPKRSDFASWSATFIADHRLGLIADVLDELQGPRKGSVEAANRDRWSAWQDGVLACLPNANALAAEIVERRGGVDADAEDWFSIKHEIEQLVAATSGNMIAGPVFIPSAVLCERIGHVEGVRLTGRGLATMLNRFTGVADAARLQRSSSRAHGHGRGYVWMPEDREEASRQVSYPAWQYLDPITLRQRRDV